MSGYLLLALASLPLLAATVLFACRPGHPWVTYLASLALVLLFVSCYYMP